MTSQDKEPSFEDIAKRLETIAERLEGGEAELEEALALFEEGVGLARMGTQRLDHAERKIEQLMRGDGLQALNVESAGTAEPGALRSEDKSTATTPQPPEDDLPF